jgi:hypothetical protein
MSDSILVNEEYTDDDLTQEETNQAAGLLVFLVDVYILEKRGENFREFSFWQRIFTMSQFGVLAQFMDYDNPEIKESFKEMFETINEVIPVKIENKDGVNYLVSIDKEHELYNSFFSNEKFLTIVKQSEEKFNAFTKEQDEEERSRIILQ